MTTVDRVAAGFSQLGSQLVLRGSICFWVSRIRIHLSWIRILISSSKNSKNNIDSYCFVTSLLLIYLRTMMYLQKVISKKISLTSWRSLTKLTGSGSFSQRYGSADPDPHQNVMDPQHWLSGLGGAGVQGDGGQTAATEHAPGEPRHTRGGTPAPATGRVGNKNPPKNTHPKKPKKTSKITC